MNELNIKFPKGFTVLDELIGNLDASSWSTCHIEYIIQYNGMKFRIKCDFNNGSSSLPGWNSYRNLSKYNETTDEYKGLIDDRKLFPYTEWGNCGTYSRNERILFVKEFVKRCCEYLERIYPIIKVNKSNKKNAISKEFTEFLRTVDIDSVSVFKNKTKFCYLITTDKLTTVLRTLRNFKYYESIDVVKQTGNKSQIIVII